MTGQLWQSMACHSPTRPARGPWRRTQRAFTLIELLVVTFIIALFAGIVVLTIGITGTDREMEREINRLQGLLGLLKEEAELENLDYGVLFTAHSYRFFIFDHVEGAWLEPAADTLLEPYVLEDPLTFELRVEERDVDLDEQTTPEILEMPNPQVVLFSTGESTPFELALYRKINGGRYHLTSALDGTMEVREEGFDE